MFTVKELVSRWKVHERTVRRYLGEGRLPCIRVGRAVRIPEEEVLRFEAANDPVLLKKAEGAS